MTNLMVGVANSFESELGFTAGSIAEGVTLQQTSDHIHIEFEKPQRVLSSAVLNGGFYQANHFLNMRVPKRCPLSLEGSSLKNTVLEDPEITLKRYCDEIFLMFLVYFLCFGFKLL